MKKTLTILGLAFVVVCAFSALITTSAFGVLTFELAQWLVNGELVSAALLDHWLFEYLWTNSRNSRHIECSGLYEGTIGSNGVDIVTSVYDLLGRMIKELSGEGLLCEALAVCEKVTPNDTELWPVNLPWKMEVE